MKYTVQKLAKLAGISVRTLHYYDEIGLLKPTRIGENRYRYYEENELLRLQQILFFKELDFPLDEIVKIMSATQFDTAIALHDQKELLALKKERIERLINTIDTRLKSLKGGETMNTDDLFASFDDQELVHNMQEAKRRWGNTDAYRQSIERVKHWTKDDYEKFKEDSEAWTKKMADIMNSGASISSDEVQQMIDQHYNGLKIFYEPNYEMYKGLGQLYVDDPKFTAYYDRHAEGLAKFMCYAMVYYSDQHMK